MSSWAWLACWRKQKRAILCVFANRSECKDLIGRSCRKFLKHTFSGTPCSWLVLYSWWYQPDVRESCPAWLVQQHHQPGWQMQAAKGLFKHIQIKLRHIPNILKWKSLINCFKCSKVEKDGGGCVAKSAQFMEEGGQVRAESIDTNTNIKTNTNINTNTKCETWSQLWHPIAQHLESHNVDDHDPDRAEWKNRNQV